METPSQGGLLTPPRAAGLALENDFTHAALRPPHLKLAAVDMVFYGGFCLFFLGGMEEVLGVSLKICS